MKIVRHVRYFAENTQGVAVTIGNFDGVHVGHQCLLQALRAKAAALRLPVVVVLFEPQPREYFSKTQAPPRLSTLREKCALLRDFGVDYVYCIPFNCALAQTGAADFAAKHVFGDLRANYLLVGEDFRFGAERSGDIQLLQTMGKAYGCEVETYADFHVENNKASSTKVRSLLQQGQLEQAKKLLGRSYSVCARVVRGDGRGRMWGIPTANLNQQGRVLALNGVFAIQAKIGGRLINGVANAGRRPTVDGIKYVLEVHLFDFDQSIYGEFMQVFFLHKLRDEVKFDSVEALIAQIHRDSEAARAVLVQYTPNAAVP